MWLFTAQDAIFEYRTITFYFDDEGLPAMLRAAVEVSPADTCIHIVSRLAYRYLDCCIFSVLPVVMHQTFCAER